MTQTWVLDPLGILPRQPDTDESAEQPNKGGVLAQKPIGREIPAFGPLPNIQRTRSVTKHPPNAFGICSVPNRTARVA
jgi:hypothetical protein